MNARAKRFAMTHLFGWSKTVRASPRSSEVILPMSRSQRTKRSAAIMVALDNLGKGMAGQAVQSMNIALGLPETAGLWTAVVSDLSDLRG